MFEFVGAQMLSIMGINVVGSIPASENWLNQDSSTLVAGSNTIHIKYVLNLSLFTRNLHSFNSIKTRKFFNGFPSTLLHASKPLRIYIELKQERKVQSFTGSKQLIIANHTIYIKLIFQYLKIEASTWNLLFIFNYSINKPFRYH